MLMISLVFFIPGERLYCRYCAQVVNHIRRRTVEGHRKSTKHLASKAEYFKLRENSATSSSGNAEGVTTTSSTQSVLASHVRQTGLAEGFNKATIQQEAKQELITDLARALVASDIAFEKMNNPVMRQFLKKHVINGGVIPGADRLHENLSPVYDAHREQLSALFGQHSKFAVVADETTDDVGRCVLNVLLIPDLSRLTQTTRYVRI